MQSEIILPRNSFMSGKLLFWRKIDEDNFLLNQFNLDYQFLFGFECKLFQNSDPHFSPF